MARPPRNATRTILYALWGSDVILVARIKKSSKYWGQTPPNAWFDVRIVEDAHYQLRGNNNNYRVLDVVLGARLASGAVLDFSNGKKIVIDTP